MCVCVCVCVCTHNQFGLKIDHTCLSMFHNLTPEYMSYPLKCPNHHKTLNVISGDKGEFMEDESTK